MMPQDKELEWNLGAERVRTIGGILHNLRQFYAQAQSEPTQENVYNYLTMLKTLYMEIFAYIDDDRENGMGRTEIMQQLRDAHERLDDLKDTGQWKRFVDEPLQDLEDLDMEINAARIEAGLDIPASTKLDPETALVDGLRDG